MRKPKTKNLKIDLEETRRIRSSISQQKSVKITINIDSSILTKLRTQAEKSGVPYQRLINRILAEQIEHNDSSETKLDRIERELRNLKKKLAA